MAVELNTIVIAGLQVNVYTSSDRKPTADTASPREVAVLFLLHDGLNSAKRIGWVAHSILKQISQKRLQQLSSSSSTELLVITIDHRNHGTRTVDRKANYAWSKKSHRNNDNHAVDMYAIQVGTARDLSFLMDFLPAYLYPSGERVITQYIVSGISLGGNSAWLALAHDSRVKIGVFLISSPDYAKLIAHIAKRSDICLVPPIMPGTLDDTIKANDPATLPYRASDSSNPFYGKRILGVFGGADDLVPWSVSRNFYKELVVGKDGSKQAIVLPGVGHECTPEMVEKLVDFVWQEAFFSVPQYKANL